MSKLKLTNKNKIIIAVATLGVFVIAGVISLVLVLAATQQRVSSNIRVTYVSNNVSAEVTGKYWYDMASSVKTDMVGGSNGTLTFNASDTSGTGSLTPNGDIALTTQNKRVVFEYAFKNLSTSSAFTVELTSSPRTAGVAANYNNVTEKYYVSAVEVPVSTLQAMNFSTTLNIQPVMKQREGENDTVYIYVVAEIANLADDANYQGSFTWEMNYVSTDNIETVTLNNNGGTGDTSMEVVTLTALQISENKTMNMPAIFSKPTKTDTLFLGYFTAASEGTKYISLNGSPVHANDLDFTSSVTLYAHYDDNLVVSDGVITELTEMGKSQTQIDVPEGITGIGDDAFMNATSLETVNLPVTLTSIGSNAFASCTSLTAVNFDTVESGRNLSYTSSSLLTSVGDTAFAGCSSLVSIEIPGTASLGNGVFISCGSLKNITAPIFNFSQMLYDGFNTNNPYDINLTINGSGAIPAGAFKNCSVLAKVVIGSGVTSLGGSAFNGSSVTELEFYGQSLDYANPSTGEDSSSYLFHQCTRLTKIVLRPSQSTQLAMTSFAGCSSLTDVTISPNVSNLKYNAFGGCSSLTSIVVPATTTIANDVFLNCPNLRNLTGKFTNSGKLPRSGTAGSAITSNIKLILTGVSDIYSSAFLDCSALADVSLPNTLTTIEKGAFRNTSLKSIVIPGNVRYIGESAFANCSNLTTATAVPNSGVELGFDKYVFQNCTNLTTVTLGEGIIKIGAQTFENDSKIAGTIVLPTSLRGIGYRAFHECNNIKTLQINSKLTQVNGDHTINATQSTSYEPFAGVGTACGGVDIIFGANSSMTEIPAFLFNAPDDGQMLVNSLTFEGNNITQISTKAFQHVRFTRNKITLPESITTIGESAFQESTIRVLEMLGVNNIGRKSFYNCEHLETVIVRDINTFNTSKAPFKYCYGLYEVYNLGTKTLTAGSDDNGCIAKYAKVVHDEHETGVCTYPTTSGYVNYNGVRYFNDNGNYIASGPVDINATSVVISHPNCTQIGRFAFHYYRNLATVTITSPVTFIGEEAFSQTSITSFTVPATVTTMEKLIFVGNDLIGACMSGEGGVTFEDSTATWTITRTGTGAVVDDAYVPTDDYVESIDDAGYNIYNTYFTTEDDDNGGYAWSKNSNE